MLNRRELGRATLARQLLTGRRRMTPLDAVEHLVGLQAQAPNAPYLGLWTRLERFALDDLTGLLEDRRVVRSSVLRGTQHLVSANDLLWLRPLLQPALDRGRQAAFGKATAGIDLAELATAGRDLLTGRTLTRPELGRRLVERWPGRDPAALAWSVQYLVPIVHPPPNGTWRQGGTTPFMLADEWLHEPLPAAPAADAPVRLVRRYLTAFGPANVADIQGWSGLSRLRPVIDSMSDELITFVDESGRELVDLYNAPRPDPDTPLPVRLLPEYDNLVVAHADRRRFLGDHQRDRVITGSLVRPTIWIDGQVAGTWSLERGARVVVLTLSPFMGLPDSDLAELTAEAEALLAFAAADIEAGDRIVRMQAPPALPRRRRR